MRIKKTTIRIKKLPFHVAPSIHPARNLPTMKQFLKKAIAFILILSMHV